jgi:hypothetical protein
MWYAFGIVTGLLLCIGIQLSADWLLRNVDEDAL